MSTKAISPATVLQAEVMPRLLYDLEAKVVDLECELLEMLTPTQFQLVQKLRGAVEVLTAVEFAGSERPPAADQSPRLLRGGRDRRRAALDWLRARRPRRVA